MRRLLPLLLAAWLASSCSPAPTAARPSPAPSPSPVPTIPPLVVGPPAALILDGPQAGLTVSGRRDHLTLEEAASLEQNQPLALTRFRSWGWVDESTRTWAGPGGPLDEALLLLTRIEGARLAFSDLAGSEVPAPGPCPSGPAVDECAEGTAGSGSVLVARLDRYVFTLRGAGVDLGRLAALQADRIRG